MTAALYRFGFWVPLAFAKPLVAHASLALSPCHFGEWYTTLLLARTSKPAMGVLEAVTQALVR